MEYLPSDSILPSQYFADRHGHNPATKAMRSLYLAILEDALRIIRSGKKAIQEYAWVMDRNSEIFGFVNVCEMLDIEPDSLRNLIASGELASKVMRRRPASRLTYISSPRWRHRGRV